MALESLTTPRRLILPVLFLFVLSGCPRPIMQMSAPLSPDFTMVKIFYVTDRNKTGVADPAGFYGNDRGNIELGTCDVSIPRDHRIGFIERPISIWRLEFREDPSKHVVLLSVVPHPKEKFESELRARVASSKRNEALVFVHGYNVTFVDATRRTAQMAYDLEFDGAPILYSWPSNGTLGGYVVDETNIEWTIPHLQKFLEEVVSLSGAHTVHLIAHSMGNRALTRALAAMTPNFESPSIPAFKHLVLTAPDIDAEVFKSLAKEFVKAVDRTTLYVSANDKALTASKRFHGYSRAGDSGSEIVIVPHVDTIDATAVDTSFIGHAYYGENRSVLSDLFYLIGHGTPPGNRFGLIRKQKSDGHYWEFRPSR